MPPRILHVVKVTSFQSSEPSWKSFRSPVKTRCSMSCPPAPKEIIHKQIGDPSHGFSCCCAAFYEIHSFFICSFISERSRSSVWPFFVPCCCTTVFLFPVFPSSLTRLCRIQHLASSVSSCGDHATATQCLVKDVPPASRSITHTLCRFFVS